MFDSNQFFGAQAGFYPLTIDQSLRFNDDDSAYLSRTPASAGNRKTWTWSGWVKRGNLGTTQHLFNARDASTYANISFSTANKLQVQLGTPRRRTNRLFRDTSSWYHIVVICDTTDATGDDRLQVWINGVRETSFDEDTDPTLNADYAVNNTIQHGIGADVYGSTSYTDGYMAEVHFTDGTAYDADAFGEFKEGVWVAKAPSVTYGTNGFYLDFANSADIGNDVSGEGNDWTPNNFTASDVVLDSPTDNFATLSPLSGGGTLSNGNLDVTVDAALSRYSTIPIIGKKYWELTVASNNFGIGLVTEDQPRISTSGSGTLFVIYGNLDLYTPNCTATVDTFSSASANDVFGFAFDEDAGTCDIYQNNSLIASLGSFTISGKFFFAIDRATSATSPTHSVNFGQQDFTYTPPSGYLALSTANLPDPAIDPAQGSSPEDYFGTVLYSGNSSTQAITGVGFQPDWVWIKSRNTSGSNHVLTDAVRGVSKYLRSNATDAEQDFSAGVTSFDSDGFTLLQSSSSNEFNVTGRTYVAWNWKANGSGVSNTDGSITSTVSANTESGFSIVSYTGNGNASQTVGHGLGSAPSNWFVIIKNRTTGSTDWPTFHSSISSGRLKLNTTDADFGNYPITFNTDTITLPSVNDLAWSASSNDYIAYCFHSVEGFSKFGSYTGNGSTDGSFVYCGFRPSFVMIKRTDSADDWLAVDTKRSVVNDAGETLFPNLSDAEANYSTQMDILSNGFKLRNSGGSKNASGGTYIFMAFAEMPFRYSLAR